MTTMANGVESVDGETARQAVYVSDCSVQAKAQRRGIYTCCEMLNKLHSVRLTLTFHRVFSLVNVTNCTLTKIFL